MILSKLSTVIKELDVNLAEPGGHIILQKKMYLLQELGFEEYYRFRWYRMGPWNSTLSRDALITVDMEEYVTPMESLREEEIAKIKQLDKILSPHEKDLKWIDLISSLHFIYYKMCQREKSRAFVFKELEKTRGKLWDKDKIDKAFDIMLRICDKKEE